LSQPGHENRAEIYAKGEWKQETTFSHFAIRAREAERLADFYTDLFELEARNLPSEEGGYHLTDGRMTMAIVPWKISSFNGAGIEQPGMDHIGFRVPDIKAFEANRDMVAKTNIQLAPKPIPFDAEGAARLALLQKCPHGAVQLADPDGTLIDVAQDHS
jgi:catechol 2,3-dioxygenase-like lactoylglutathione lyase family enzyme